VSISYTGPGAFVKSPSPQELETQSPRPVCASHRRGAFLFPPQPERGSLGPTVTKGTHRAERTPATTARSGDGWRRPLARRRDVKGVAGKRGPMANGDKLQRQKSRPQAHPIEPAVVGSTGASGARYAQSAESHPENPLTPNS